MMTTRNGFKVSTMRITVIPSIMTAAKSGSQFHIRTLTSMTPNTILCRPPPQISTDQSGVNLRRTTMTLRCGNGGKIEDIIMAKHMITITDGMCQMQLVQASINTANPHYHIVLIIPARLHHTQRLPCHLDHERRQSR